jgi:serine/threonine-protein kinase HipA
MYAAIGFLANGSCPAHPRTDYARQLIFRINCGCVHLGTRRNRSAGRPTARAGLSVAPVELRQVAGKAVLLVERFDRKKVDGGWQRRSMISALTPFGLDERQAHHASYAELAEIIRAAKATLRELYGRMVFNVLCGNTDDHARNQAAFWDGEMPTLTPAYDI